VKARLLTFAATALVAWLLITLPVRLLWGDEQAVYSTAALLLCLVPALATLGWVTWAARYSPEQQLVGVLGGTGVRLFVVGGAAIALYNLVGYFREAPGFWTWVLVWYLLTLALEVSVLLLGGPTPARPRGTTSSPVPERQESSPAAGS
jgi:hypothetical protein